MICAIVIVGVVLVTALISCLLGRKQGRVRCYSCGRWVSGADTIMVNIHHNEYADFCQSCAASVEHTRYLRRLK